MTDTQTSSSPEAMTRQRAAHLCAQMEALSRSHTLVGGLQAQEQLAGAIKNGWTPFLHDFTERQRGSGAHLFAERAAHGPLFKMIMDEFPCAEDYFPLLEASEWRRIAALRPMSPTGQDLCTSWHRLGSPQRALLVERDLLAPSLPATLSNLDIAFWWLHAMSQALWLPRSEPHFGEAPFHGFFESSRWGSLSTSQPALANTLAIYLYCLSAAAALASPEDHGALAWMRAAGEAMPVGSSHILEIARLRMIASWTLEEAVRIDHAEIFMHLVRHLGIDPIAQEKSFFARMPSTPEECLRHSAHSIKEFSGIRPASPSKNSSPEASSLAKAIAEFNNRSSGYHARPLASAKEFAPLFSACAQLKAEACWDALCAAFPPPLSLMAKPTQTVMVSNMAHIEKHRLLCQRRSLESGASQSSKTAMAENLAQRAEHARKTISILPFSKEDRKALLAGDSIAHADLESSEASRLFDPEDIEDFKANNGPALRRALSGKQAALAVVARYPWCAHMLARGASAEFLKTKLPIGSLSAAGDFFTSARLEKNQRSLMGAGGMAAMEQDALALAIGAPLASAPPRKPRL